MRVHVQFILPENKITTGKLPAEARLLVHAKGWLILRAILQHPSLQIDLSHHNGEDALITNRHPELFTNALSEGFSVEHIYPDTINLQLDTKVTKKLPVSLVTDLRLKNNYVLSDTVSFYPDSVIVFGAASYIDPLRTWPTEKITVNSADTVYSGNIALQDPQNENISLSAVAVHYSIPVAPLLHRDIWVHAAFPDSRDSAAIQLIYSVPENQYRDFTADEFSVRLKPDSLRNGYTVECSRYPDALYTIQAVPSFISKPGKK